jgi:hypothetical protein
MGSSVYDEEAAKSFDHHADVEYGIMITKVRSQEFTKKNAVYFYNCTCYQDQRGSADDDDPYTVNYYLEKGIGTHE